MEDGESPSEQLLRAIRSALHARAAEHAERVRRVQMALDAYRDAVELELAREFAREHGFKQPPAPAITSDKAAQSLDAAVRSLPELSRSESSPTPPLVVSTLPPESSRKPTPEPPVRLPARYPRLLTATQAGRIVIIGALTGRDRTESLAPELAKHVEWIDTAREGSGAVGNLPQRIRQGRVAAVVILERAVQHRHTEPVMAAAREAGVPAAFAGKGGTGALSRALEQLENSFAQRA
jgi:hypothetical protein